MVHKRRNTSTKKGCVSIEACLKTGRPRKQIRLMMMIIINNNNDDDDADADDHKSRLPPNLGVCVCVIIYNIFAL